MTPTPTVFVIDDDSSIRTAVERLVVSAGFHCETFASADDYLQAAREDVPGCLILDVRMPGSSGLDLQHALKESGHERPIIFLTAHADVPVTLIAMKGGALELLTKPPDPEELLEAVRHAIDRDTVERAGRLRRLEVAERYRALTPREREVMEAVIAGLANKETAQKLDISVRTVKAHRAEVMRKMEAESVADLVRMGRALGLAEPEV